MAFSELNSQFTLLRATHTRCGGISLYFLVLALWNRYFPRSLIYNWKPLYFIRKYLFKFYIKTPLYLEHPITRYRCKKIRSIRRQESIPFLWKCNWSDTKMYCIATCVFLLSHSTLSKIGINAFPVRLRWIRLLSLTWFEAKAQITPGLALTSSF